MLNPASLSGSTATSATTPVSSRPRYGENIVSLYECVLIARNDVTQQQVEDIADGIANRLEPKAAR